jgi:hypothetical protein
LCTVFRCAFFFRFGFDSCLVTVACEGTTVGVGAVGLWVTTGAGAGDG